MRSGRLCSSGGSGWTSTGQLRRSATSATCRAIAPHATTATRCAASSHPFGAPRTPSTGCEETEGVRSAGSGEGEAVDEAVVEVGAVGEFDVVHLLQEGAGGGAFAD